MCIICIDMQRGALTIPEARRNFAEMEASLDPEHREEVREKLAPKTIYEYGDDLDLWWLVGYNHTTGSD